MNNAAVIYVRVSTDEQARGGVSLDAQEERLRAYCALKGFEVVKVIREEGVSAGKPLHKRPGGAELIRMIERKEVGHVVAYKLDRLFRNTADCAARVAEWDRKGIGLHFVDMGGQAVDTSSAMGRFFLNVMAGVAELERGLIAERTAAALNHKKNHLEPYSPTPYGYDRNGDRLEINPEEKDVVYRILGMRTQGLSYHKIAKTLNDEGIRTKNGKRWYASTVRYIIKNQLHRKKHQPIKAGGITDE